MADEIKSGNADEIRCGKCRRFTPYTGAVEDGVQLGGCGEWCTNVRADWGCDGGAYDPIEGKAVR